MAKKRPYPSQERYNEKKPTVSFRVSLREKLQLKEMAEKEGMCVGDLVRKSLLKQAGHTSSAYTNGLNMGYNDAKRKFCFSCPCSKCGKTMFFSAKELKKHVGDKLRRYVHEECG